MDKVDLRVVPSLKELFNVFWHLKEFLALNLKTFLYQCGPEQLEAAKNHHL